MADPHHIAELDAFDRVTVRVYRGGILATALLLLGSAALHLAGGVEKPHHELLALALTLSVAASCQSVHLYLKLLRWLLPVFCWTGAALQLCAPHASPALQPWLSSAGLGFVFVALSGLALKERICFRIPGLVAVPLLLATSLIPWLSGQHLATGALHALAGAVLARLAHAKMQQPLHFDIGDKSAYQL